MKKTSIFVLSIALELIAIVILQVNVWPQQFEHYFLYLGTYPYSANTGYHEDVQGITHDKDCWYITQSDADDSDPAERSLWKIPISHDLSSVSPNDSGIKRISLDDITELASKAYNHFGDLSYYKNEKYDGKGYLVIPVTGSSAGIIAVFRASDLGYIGSAALSGGINPGWCAIDPEGYAYASGNNVNKCDIYKLRWNLIPTEVKIKKIGDFPFLDEYGNPLTFTSMQGGVISESGNLLYVVSGYYADHEAHDGINVFDMQTNRRVAHSTNGYGHFNYEFHAGVDAEEPEGITIWDLDDGRAPGITGQLHVLMLDNDASADEVYLKHYTGTIHVDKTHTGSEEGTPSQPFNSITEAYNLAWNGAKIKIQEGSYPEILTINKQLLLFSSAGSVVIGSGR